MKFGAKFRIERFSSWDMVLLSLFDDLNDNAFRLSKKLSISLDSFQPWLKKMQDVINVRVLRLRKSFRIPSRPQFSLKAVKSALSSLQDRFVIWTVDKASNNFAFVCKKFYISVLLDELGIDKSSFLPVGNATYSPITVTASDVLDSHVRELKARFNVLCSAEDCVLAKLFWIPKLHKNPFKFRFIAGARHCTTKPLSLIVNQGLALIKKNFRAYCDAIHRNSGYNFFWSINSTLEFINKIQGRKVYNLQVFDFSTLYTNLNQLAVLQHLDALFELVFNSASRKFLCVRYDKCFFSGKTYQSYSCFDLQMFKDAVRFVVNEVYVSFGGFLFKQIKGIPMGGNCSPLLADLFLAHCEFDFMSDLLKSKKFGLARLLSYTSRYIDDLCFLNYKHFDSIRDKIYPSDLLAERSGDNDKLVDYLDVQLEVGDQTLRSSVFHKVDNFQFSVILLTFPNSLIPLKMGYQVFAGQVLRYLRICSEVQDFIDKTRKTFLLLESRGYSKNPLQYYMEKILSRNSLLLHKFGLFSARQVSDLIGFCD